MARSTNANRNSNKKKESKIERFAPKTNKLITIASKSVYEVLLADQRNR